MKKEFPGYFSGAAADVEKMWDECIFVLDANVLLNLYRYSDFTCSKLLEVFNSLADRLWVPHQVVYEYLNNRLPVIGEQGKIYDDAVKKVESLRKSLENHNQHPFVTAQTLADSLQLFDRILADLSQNKLVHEKRIHLDEIKDQLERLLEGKVGEGFSREQLDKVIIDGRARYEQKTPPGFCDVKKGGDSVVFSEICRPYGDYIVWLQIIEQAKALSKPVIFVTGDTKDDWWASYQGKTLGPHPQLVQEFLLLVEKDFYMYPPDRFLERASEYLKQDASEQAVKEIRDIRKEDSEVALLDKEEALTSWAPPKAVSSKNFLLKWLFDERATVQERYEQISARLAKLIADRKVLLEFQNGLIAIDVKPDDSSFTNCVENIERLEALIDHAKVELSMTRSQMMALMARQQKLQVAEGGESV